MQYTSYPTAAAFLADNLAYLEQNEVVNSLALGVALRLARHSERVVSTPYFARVAEDERTILAAVQEPPFPLLLAGGGYAPAAALELLARSLLADGRAVSGVNGPEELSGDFVALYAPLAGVGHRLKMYQCVYRLIRVRDADGAGVAGRAPGRLRLATEADLEIVAAWAHAMSAEALGENDRDAAWATARRRLANGEVYLWDDGRPVSVAARARPTAHGVTVNFVYTPPELRGRGYATASVAALSRLLLDEGYDFCTLFTDLANPTSNYIYLQIGYEPVCDFHQYVFE